MISQRTFNPAAQAGPAPCCEGGRTLGRRFDGSWFSALTKRFDRHDPPALPEVRVDDAETVAQRKAEALIRSVRHGAVRR